MDAQKFPHVDEHQSSTASHEMGIVETASTGMRRELSRRHINMIGLAGMIVSCSYFA
jgi:amino acid permease